MEYFRNYLVNNFFLLILIVVMIVIFFFNNELARKKGYLALLIMGFVFVLSLTITFEEVGKDYGLFFLTCLSTYLGYSLRIVVIYLFLLMARDERDKFDLILLIPVILNALVYLPGLFYGVDGLNRFAFFYEETAAGVLEYHRGYLNYFAHFVSLFYLCALIYFIFKKLNGKHREDGIVIIVCSVFVVIAVVLEMFSIGKNLLNVTIAFSCLLYYSYLYIQDAKRDALTHLFIRRTYYRDIDKFGKSIDGVISIDMNRLKYLNDTFGHEKGDEGLIAIADAITNSIDRSSMIVYRVGGDEFTVTAINSSEEILKEVSDKIKERLKTTEYTVSIGYAYKKVRDESYDSLLKRSEEKMYEDKSTFYRESHIERRKSR